MSNGMYHGDESITVTTRAHATSDEVTAAIAVLDDPNVHTEIPDGVALAIAAGWASPGGVGRHFAQLATTGTVRLQDLGDDMSATFDACRRVFGAGSSQMRELDCLATWALNHDSRA